MNAYSYIRWSSDQQTLSDSLRRQTETAKAVCAAKGWKLIDLPPDVGISGWKGKNLHTGHLGNFLNKVNAGEIPTPSVLIVEKLDRFSRFDCDEVIPIFMKLLKSGIQVYSVVENQHYTKEQLRDNPLNTILQMTMAFVAANQYSRALSERVKAAKQNQIKNASNGVPTLVPRVPLFFTWTGNGYILNDNAKIVKRIFNEYLTATKSLQSIACGLNDDKIKPMGPAKYWVQGLVAKILRSRYVLGEYKGRNNYFPRIITDEDFNKVEQLLTRNRCNKGKKSERINIFKGSIFCAECGKPAVIYTCETAKYVYYRCLSRYQHKCSQKHMMAAHIIEEQFFTNVLVKLPEELIKNRDKKLDADVTGLQAAMIKHDKAIEQTVNLIGEPDMPIDQLKKKLAALQMEKRTMEKALKEMLTKANTQSALPENIQQLAKLIQGDDQTLKVSLEHLETTLKDAVIRQKLQLLLPNILKRITLDFDGAVIGYELVSGSTMKLPYLG